MLRDKVRTAHALSVNEIYESIQGEGILIGTPSAFLRLQGCNLRCPWCDQPDALDFRKDTLRIDEILDKLRDLSPRHVVITGGEPFAQQDLPYLVKALIKEGYSVQIETNGTLWQEGMEEVADIVHITCSPKAVARFFVHPKVLDHAKELKFVVDEDLSEEALLRAEFSNFLQEGNVTLQPEGNKRRFFEKAIDLCDKLTRRGLKVRVLPQMHKLLGIR